MCAKFGCGPMVVSKKRGGTDRQTKKTAALYSRLAGLSGFARDSSSIIISTCISAIYFLESLL